MMPSKLTVETRDHVLLMGLNRVDKRNAVDLEMYRLLASAYKQLEADSELRCGVLFAHGDHFTAGVDLKEWAPVFASGRGLELPEGAIDPLGLDEQRRVSKPIVIAVQGWCLTIGLELLLAADIRIAADNTQFAQIEVKRGIYAIGGATVRLPREIGWSNAMRYLLTGDQISAAEALRLGLVQEVVPAGQHLKRAEEIAEVIAEQAPLAVQATLRSARLAYERGSAEAIARFSGDMATLMKSEDAREGLASFLEKRKARFSGR